MPNVIRSTVSLDFQSEAEHGEFQTKNWEPIVLFTFLCCEIIIFRLNLRCMIWSSLEKKPKTCPLIKHGFTEKNTPNLSPFSALHHKTHYIHSLIGKMGWRRQGGFLFVWKGYFFRGCCCQTSNSFNLQLMLFCFKYG